MVNKKIFLLIFSIFSYCVAFSIYLFDPVLIENELYIDLNKFCCIFTMLSHFLLFHRFQDKKGMKFTYIILFFMTYIALVLGNHPVYDFAMRRVLQYYRNNNLTESYQYELLHNEWIWDTDRTFIVVLGFFYSLLTTLIYFIFVKILRIFVKILRKKKKNQTH